MTENLEDENIMLQVNDIRLFNLEKEQDRMIDFEKGIKGMFLQRLDNPERFDPFLLFFLGTHGWTPERVQAWLEENPQYRSSALVAEKSAHNDTKAKLLEAIRTTKMSEAKRAQIIELFEGIIPDNFILNAWGLGSGASRLAQDIKKTVRLAKGGEEE
jgi:hypothetical protein